MSYTNMQYTSPAWDNQAPPPVNASNLLDIGHALEALNITQEQRSTLEAGTSDALGTILAALKTSIDSDIASINSAVRGKGNCKIASGGYIGNGQYGSSTPTSIYVGFMPLFLYCYDTYNRSDNAIFYIYNGNMEVDSSIGISSGLWTNSTITGMYDNDIYAQNKSGKPFTFWARSANTQLNYTSRSYRWVAIG